MHILCFNIFRLRPYLHLCVNKSIVRAKRSHIDVDLHLNTAIEHIIATKIVHEYWILNNSRGNEVVNKNFWTLQILACDFISILSLFGRVMLLFGTNETRSYKKNQNTHTIRNRRTHPATNNCRPNTHFNIFTNT